MNSSVPSIRRAARGFTIVELMVALAIGLALTVVIAQLFLGSRQTFRTTDDVSRMQENIRFTYQLLTRTIHLAGYKTSPNTRVEDIFNAATPVLAGAEGATAAAPDTFTVRFQGSSNGPGAADGTVVDCLGRPVGAGVMSTNIFTLQVGANGANALFCQSLLDGAAAQGPSELVSDIETMQVAYGVDTDNNLVVDSYVPANLVADMNQVRSVRVALLFRTANVGASPAPSTLVHDVNGVNFGPYADTRVRRPVTMTVNMRNRTP